MTSDEPLGDFLRARRESITPTQAGLLYGGPREGRGVRREEVALLAGLSTDYYVRLEEGRERHPSDRVISALARVFDLDTVGVAHLYALARRPEGTGSQPLDQWVVRTMQTWLRTPAFVMSRRMDVLAMNPLAMAYYQGLRGGVRVGDNIVETVFLNRAAQEFYAEWDDVAASRVAHLSATAGPDVPGSPLRRLVEDVAGRSDEFRRQWSRRGASSVTRESRLINHGLVGEVRLVCSIVPLAGASGRQLVVMQADPGSPSERALDRLGRLAIEPARAAGCG